MHKFFDNKGFALIELLVAMAIIVILSFTILFDFDTGQKKLALQRDAYKLAQDIKRAQEMAMSGIEIDCDDGLPFVPAVGYGIHFKKSAYKDADGQFYILFAECSGNEQYNSGTDIEVEKIYLIKGIEITKLKPSDDFGIFFQPPDPVTYISNFETGQTAEIEISCEDDTSITRSIIVNNAGLVEVK
ncbi:type II secretion system protein [Candidatus Parcubacteria bacterium]|nr:type II secretion system protein [Candidatus Parcubacteria bacterium]